MANHVEARPTSSNMTEAASAHWASHTCERSITASRFRMPRLLTDDELMETARPHLLFLLKRLDRDVSVRGEANLSPLDGRDVPPWDRSRRTMLNRVWSGEREARFRSGDP